jgi:hypothetical protein
MTDKPIGSSWVYTSIHLNPVPIDVWVLSAETVKVVKLERSMVTPLAIFEAPANMA